MVILSLGAGVQSSTLALMAAHGEVGPMPDAAIFADTGHESRRVYEWLDWLSSGNVLPFPVVRVKRDGPNLGELWLDVVEGRRDRSGSALPGFWLSPAGMSPFQCSKEFKTRVIGREIRRMLGLDAGQRGPKEVVVEQWLGISSEEMERMKDNEMKFVRNRWPLIELRMRRRDCLKWMADHGYPEPPRSSCTFCPYRRDDEWRLLRDESPQDWQDAVKMDKAIRSGWPGMEGHAWLHRDRVPLDSADMERVPDLFDYGLRQECEGACGT
jgi:hypothetical protein